MCKIRNEEIKKIKEEYKNGLSILKIAKKYHRDTRTISEIVKDNNEITFCAPYRFPLEMQKANLEIKKFMQTVRESATYC